MFCVLLRMMFISIYFFHSFLALLYKTICYFIFGAILDKSPIEWQVTMNCYVAWTGFSGQSQKSILVFFCYFKFVDCGQISYSKMEYSTLNFDWNRFCRLFCGRNCICFAYITIDEFNWTIFVRNRCALQIRSFIRLICFLNFLSFFFLVIRDICLLSQQFESFFRGSEISSSGHIHLYVCCSSFQFPSTTK